MRNDYRQRHASAATLEIKVISGQIGRPARNQPTNA